MCDNSFYICKRCKNLIGMINNSGVPIICCGEPMSELIPNTMDASVEKHVPVASINGETLTVEIGSAAHPMTDNHYIQWVYLQAGDAVQRKCLKPGDLPKATFALGDEKPQAVYAYCNLHGLWKAEI